MTILQTCTAAALITLVLTGTGFAQGTSGATGDEMVKAAQQALKDKGHDPGRVDGRMGPKTQAALREFQKAQGMAATGDLDAKTTDALGMNGKSTSSKGASSTAGSASPATTK
jgi:peptidoglycan hydrolase-like protein with peptidoglycan-binding domain